MSTKWVETKANGTIKPKQSKNTRVPYEHQKEAMECLSKIDKQKESYSTLIVLPTGGGKTYTSVTWLLKNAIDNNKKVLWIAHRHFLLDQAADSFQNCAYAEQMPHITEFTYRIVSGSTRHDKTISIKKTDSVIIASKDSIGRNINRLDKWLKDENEIYMVIDEAHHATAKTYRNVIEYVKSKVEHTKIIGLTATPYRTADNEQGLLKKVFPDGVAFSISLKELINRQILSRLELEEYQTGEEFGKDIGKNAWESIVHRDTIPEDIAEKMVESRERNHLIVDTYKKNQKKYGQTIVFAVSIAHAIALTALFKKEKIKADFVVSSIKDAGTGVTVSPQTNEERIEAYKKGDLNVLVNVEVLTEGIDLPETKTVFLARPTVSKTLLTQMIGRALRGVKAGGTAVAYGVSFIDNWDIPFVYPENILSSESGEFDDETKEQREQRQIRLISISKLEEFARLLDETVDTTALEAIPFIKRFPVGMYSFSYLDEKGMDISYQVMVYNSNKKSFEKLMSFLPKLFEEYSNGEEYLPKKIIATMEKICYKKFFENVIFPTYDPNDMRQILQYYAAKEAIPSFYSFEEIDKSQIDVSIVAQKIYDDDMGPRAQAQYLERLWNENDDNILRMFFGRKLYFLREVEIELGKLMHPEDYKSIENVKYGKKQLEELTLHEISKVDPAYFKKLQTSVLTKSKDVNGFYHCALCGKQGRTRRGFMIDHIVAMNNGGRSIASNLQLLCSKCNGKKSDK